jgi:hypothetical protein
MLTRPCHRHYTQGLILLSRHEPEAAVHELQAALEACPAAKPRELYNICYYLGIALRRVGYPQCAVKSWISCQKLIKRGPIRKMLSRYTNCYGMDRQGSSQADDWQAFCAVQASRYLLAKHRHAFSSQAEHDMILDLIRDSWRDFVGSAGLDGMTGSEKMAAFKAVQIVFPSLVLSEARCNDRVISINFRTKQKLESMDRCACGSGLPFMMCCGRTPAKEELQIGVF